MSLRLGFDVDGVLADFRSAFLEAAMRILGRSAVGQSTAAALDPEVLSPEHAKQVWKILTNTPNWWLSVPPYEPVQIARLYQLARRFKWEVLFLTMRTPTAGDSAQLQTQAWLEALGFYMPSVVTMPGSRGELANASRLDLVVDDHVIRDGEEIKAQCFCALGETNQILRLDRGARCRKVQSKIHRYCPSKFRNRNPKHEIRN